MNITNDIKWILKTRTLKAAAVVLTLHVVLFAALAGFASVNFWHPLSWMYHFLLTILSPKIWFYWIPSAAALVFVGFTTLYQVQRPPQIVKCRLDYLRRLLSWQHSLQIIAYSLLTISVPVSYLNVSGVVFSQPCTDNKQLPCVNGQASFIASCAMWCGLLTVFTSLKLTFNNLPPPLISLNVSDQIRPLLWKNMKRSLAISFRLMTAFVPLYYLLSSYVDCIFGFAISAYSEDKGYFSLLVLLQTWLLSSVTCAAVLMIKKILKLFLAQYLDLPVASVVMLLDTPISPFQEQLVFKDLAQIAVGRSVVPVSDVFALSQPGGLPHNWNIILRNCLRVMITYQNQLNECQANQPADEPVKLHAEDVKKTYQMPAGLRRLQSMPLPRHEDVWDIVAPVTTRLLDLLSRANLITLRPFYYFVDKQQELHISSLFENAQTVMSAGSALSRLTCRAYTDDQFGVVVNDLPTIINSLFQLEETVTRVILPKKKLKSKLAHTMHLALSSALKRGITQIAHTYSAHLQLLPISPQRLSVLRNILHAGHEKQDGRINRSMVR